MSRAVKAQGEQIAAARVKDSILTLHAYCEGPDCAVRQVEIRVKDYDTDPRLGASYAGLRCPLCGSTLNLHGVKTSEQDWQEHDQNARSSVARQMYLRDTKGSTVPLPVFMDDRLPPTPPDWFQA